MILTKTREEIKKYEDYTINYQNGVCCYVEFINDTLIDYKFIKNDKIFYYIDDLTPYTNSHWSDHSRHLNDKSQRIFTFDELKKFTEFDKLYYIGCGSDGMVLDINLIPQTSVVLLDSIFFANWLHIETSEKECEKILKTLNDKYILESSIYYIHSYNQNEDCDEHYTLNMSILLPQNIYEKCIDKCKYGYDLNKIKMFEYLKFNREKKLKRIVNE